MTATLQTSPALVAGEALPELVLSLPLAEWAVALYHSDMPTRRGDHTPEQVMAWIVQGVERLGGEAETWRIDHAFRKAGDVRDEARYHAEMRRLFPKPRRHERAVGEAYGLSRDLEAAGVQRGSRLVWVEVPVWDAEMCVPDVAHEQVPARDVEMYPRVYGGEAPKVVPVPVCTGGFPVVMLRCAA